MPISSITKENNGYCDVYYDCNWNSFRDCKTDEAYVGDYDNYNPCHIPADCLKPKEDYCGTTSDRI